MSAVARNFRYRPTISIVTPVYNTPREYLEQAFLSVRAQVYDGWEWCLCDDGSDKSYVRELLRDYSGLDARIKVTCADRREGICGASNRALQLATGDFVGLLDHDDELSFAALFEVVALLQDHQQADFIYSDEDKLSPRGDRTSPFFKPDWSPEYLLACMYTCHFGVYRRSLLKELQGFRVGFEGSQDYDLVLRLSERTRNIFHIPKILYHWRMTGASTAGRAGAKKYAVRAGKKALEEHMDRRQINASVCEDAQPGRYRVRPAISDQPLVSIVVFHHSRFLQHCLHSVRSKTTYPNYEIVVMETHGVSSQPSRSANEKPCPSSTLAGASELARMNNRGAAQAKGSYIVFMHDDVEILAADWVSAMLEFAQLKEVGAVGAKLYNRDGSVANAGVALGVAGIIGHPHRGFRHNSRGYFDWLICTRNCSAVTAACLITRREVIELVGGFDETVGPFYDVDFCLRLRKHNLRVVWTPYAELRYCAGKTEAASDAQAEQLMQTRWGSLLENDPYYNPNLSSRSEDLRIRE